MSQDFYQGYCPMWRSQPFCQAAPCFVTIPQTPANSDGQTFESQGPYDPVFLEQTREMHQGPGPHPGSPGAQHGPQEYHGQDGHYQPGPPHNYNYDHEYDHDYDHNYGQWPWYGQYPWWMYQWPWYVHYPQGHYPPPHYYQPPGQGHGRP